MAAYQMEKNRRRKSLLRWFIGAGVIMALGMTYSLLTQPLKVSLMQNSIAYNTIAPFGQIGLAFYVATLCGSLLVSSHTFLRWAGCAGLVSFAISIWFYLNTFISVWCFFAAVLSGAVFLFIYQTRKR
jgi:hypothetical protein